MKKYLFIFAAVFFLIACDSRLSTSDLAEEVIDSMEAEFSNSGIMIDSLILTRDSSESNMYTGILETREPAGSFTYSVKVTYDGEYFTWQVE
tara:strand:- start:590 stop:865 length:276 start_codon:yes stop_codon:yes gene_type:complete